MVHEKIAKYYLLCSVGTGKIPHPIGEYSGQELSLLLNKKETELYLKNVRGTVIANESTIGGEEQYFSNTNENNFDTSISEFITQRPQHKKYKSYRKLSDILTNGESPSRIKTKYITDGDYIHPKMSRNSNIKY